MAWVSSSRAGSGEGCWMNRMGIYSTRDCCRTRTGTHAYTRTANPRSFWRDVSWSVLNESHVRCKTNRDAQLKSVILQPGVEQLVYIESPCVFRSHITSTLCESLQVMQVDESFVSVCVFFLSSSLFCLFLSIFTFFFFLLSAFLSWTFTHRAFMMHLILFTWKICTRLFLCLFFKFFFFFIAPPPLSHTQCCVLCVLMCAGWRCVCERGFERNS